MATTEHTPIDRRRFMAYGAGLLGLAALGGLALPHAIEGADIRKFRAGYEPLTEQDPLFDDIFAPESAQIISINREIEGEDRELLRGTFDLTDEAFLDLNFNKNADVNDGVSAHPLIVSIDFDTDNPIHYLVPFIKSPRQTDITAQIGLLHGHHSIKVFDYSTPDSVLDRGSLKITLQEPFGTTIQEVLRRNSPVYGIRKDNIDIDNPQKLLNDVPLFAYAKFQTNGALLDIEHFLILSSEDAGKTPVARLSRYKRTNDVEWSLIQHISPEGERFGAVCQLAHHSPAIYKGGWENGQPKLQIATDNNNFSYGDLSDILYYPKEHYVPQNIDDTNIINQNPEIQIIGFREEIDGKNGRTMADADQRAKNMLTLLRSDPVGIFPILSYL